MTDVKVYYQVERDYFIRGCEALRKSLKWSKLSKIPLVGRFALRKACSLADESVTYLELSNVALHKALKAK